MFMDFLSCFNPDYLALQMIWATITVFLPAAFSCKPMVCPRYENGTLISNAHTVALGFVLI